MRISHTILALAVLFSVSPRVPAQLALDSASPSAVIDFETGLAGVSSGPFDGLGFSPEPLSGQLDSDAWAVAGFSDGDLSFGGTAVSGDLARGTISGGGTSTGGLFALTDFPAAGGRSIAVQPGGTDFTPGAITLKISNSDDAQIVVALDVAYDIYELNDADRSSSLRFSYSADGSSFVHVPALDHVSEEAAAQSPSVTRIGGKGPSRSVSLTGLNVAPGSNVYLRWEGDDFSGTGSRDELAIDNISVSATFLGTTAAAGTISGTVSTDEGAPIGYARIELTGGAGISRVALTNQFGNFEFRELPTGDVYFVRVFSGRYEFKEPLAVVLLDGKFRKVSFEGRGAGTPLR